MVLKTCGSLLLRKIYGFISLFFPMFLSICVTYIIVFVGFFYIFCQVHPSGVLWLEQGWKVSACLCGLAKNFSPCGNFPIWKQAFFMHRKKHFLGKKITVAFGENNWGGGGGKVSIVLQCAFVSEVLLTANFVLFLRWFQLLCLKVFTYHHLCFACLYDCTCTLAVDLGLNVTAMRSSGSSLPTWGNYHGDLVSTISMK